MSWLPKYSAGLGGNQGQASPQVNVYTASGAIAVTDDIAVLLSTGVLVMTLANGTKDGHQMLIVRPDSTGGAHAVTGNFNEHSNQPLGTFGSPNGGESFLLIWSTQRTTWYRMAIDPGFKIVDLPNFVTLSDTDLLNIYQSGIDSKVDLASLVANTLGRTLPPVALAGNVTLTAAAHNRRNLYTTVATTLNLTNAATLGDFTAPLTVRAGDTITFSNGPALDITDTPITSLPASTEAIVKTLGGSIYVLAQGSGTGSVSAPVLQLSTITGQTPGGTSTASGTFNNGLPATLTATLDGSGLTITAVNITTNGGTGATAFGTFSYNFTTPAVGSHTVITASTGTYAVASNPYTLVTSATPLLTTSTVTPTGAGLINAMASGTFSNGLPATITATIDGGSLSITGTPTITTTSGSGATAVGTWSFVFTNPSVGSHTLVVSSTGTYATSASNFIYSTTTVTLVVNNISPVPKPSTAFAVSGTYSSSNWNPGSLQYSTDSTTGSNGTWTTASVSVSISGGVFSFTHPGLVAGAYKIWVRSTGNPQVFASDATFTIVAAGGSITEPGSSINSGVPATFAVTLTGTGSPTLFASLTIGGAEQTPRTSVAFGSTSVNLTPATTGAGTASLYAASSGGTALATSGGFTVATGTPAYPSLASFVAGTSRPVIYDANAGLQPNGTPGTALTGWHDALAGSGTNLTATVGVTAGATVNGLPATAFAATQTTAANSGLIAVGSQTYLSTMKLSTTVGSSFAWMFAVKAGTLSAVQQTIMYLQRNGSTNAAASKLSYDPTSGHNQFLWMQCQDGGVIQNVYFGPTPPANNAVHVIGIRYTLNGPGSWSIDTWVNGTKGSTTAVTFTSGASGVQIDSIYVGQGAYVYSSHGAKDFEILEIHPLYNGSATITDANMLLYLDNTTGYLRQKWGA